MGCGSSAGLSAPTDQKIVNRLANSTSAYLRSAAHQPVAWQEWSEASFRLAKEKDRPILLDIGAVWCHWCHVIDRESYENPEIAKMINAHYVPVKVDVDARPDIDRRYQEVIQALTGQGGWPLTVFLTPTGEVIYGGTYFPPEDMQGMPGMKSILPRVAAAYKEKKADVTAQARRLHDEIAQFAAQNLRAGELRPVILDEILAQILSNYDAEHGGFGGAPKFPAPTAIDLLLRRSLIVGEPRARDAALKSLDAMAAGGVRDQIGGAMHRYSTDRFWRVPHFEVMLYLEGEMLKLYAEAFQLTGEKRYADAGRELIGYLRSTLSDGARGGFYGSQDADASMHDDGDYWTWTLEETKAVLQGDEFEAAAKHFGIEAVGEMRENPAKNVLYIALPVESVAQQIGKSPEQVEHLIASAKKKLLSARAKRKAPFIDTTLYVNWNGLMVSGMLKASAAFGDSGSKEFALKTLERIWNEGMDSTEGLRHVIQTGGSHTRGFLEDYAYAANAFLDAYELTQESRFLERAKTLSDEMVKRFADNGHGGFFDTQVDPAAIGALQGRRKPIQDAPTPAANSAAALVLCRLHHLTGEGIYKQMAGDTLTSYAATAREFGLFAASFGIALEAYLEEPLRVVVLGAAEDAGTRALLAAAESVYRPNKVVQAVRSAGAQEHLPVPLAELVKNAGVLGQPTAFVCAGTSCARPTSDPEQLKKLVQTFGLSKAGVAHGG